MERNSTSFGISQFRVKYQETALYAGPSGISGYIGTLKKGAVVEVVGDDHPYYYHVKLDNGLEGYLYKAAGELTSGLTPTRLNKVEEAVSQDNNFVAPSLNGASPEANGANGSSRLTRVRPASASRPNLRPVTTSREKTIANSNGNGTRPTSRNGRAVVVTSGEIAVFSKPGIVGQQVGRLKRGEKATVIAQDGFFFQVALNNGQVGYIPRYAAEEV